MNLSARLKSVQREHAKLCVKCGGPLLAPPRRTWKEVMDLFHNFPPEEYVSYCAAHNLMHRLPPGLQEQAYNLYRKQQGLPFEPRSSPYSSPNPPPPPKFPEEGPAPPLNIGRWRE